MRLFPAKFLPWLTGIAAVLGCAGALWIIGAWAEILPNWMQGKHSAGPIQTGTVAKSDVSQSPAEQMLSAAEPTPAAPLSAEQMTASRPIIGAQYSSATGRLESSGALLPTAEREVAVKAAAQRVAKANRAFAEKHYADAIDQFTSALAIDPQSLDAYLGRGWSHYFLGQDFLGRKPEGLSSAGEFRSAYADFGDALLIDPLSAAAYQGRFDVDMRQADFYNAEADAQQWVRRAARDPAAFDAEGLAHLALRDPSQALGEFTQAIDLLPAAHPVGKPPVDKAIANDTSNDTQARQIQYRLDRAHAFMARGDAESALHDITLVIELDPADVAAVAEAGAIEFNRGRPDAAESWFKAWCGLQPNRIEPWYNLGTTLLAKRDPSAAIAAFDNALQIDGADAATLNNRGVALLKLGKETAARADFTRAIQAQPGYLLAVENRAAAELRSGNAVQATADYLTLVEHRPLEPKLLVDLGLAYQKRGDLDAAINNFDAAIHQDANLAVAYLDRALAYAAKSPVLLKPIDNRAVTGNTSSLVPANNPAAPLSEQAINAWYQVVRDADSAIRLDATSAVAYQTRAYAYDQLGQTARAAADLEQARKLAH